MRATQDFFLWHANLLSLGNHDLGSTGLTKHGINTGNTDLSSKALDGFPSITEFDQHLHEKEERGDFRPSVSPWTTPVVLGIEEGSRHMGLCGLSLVELGQH